MASKDNVEVSNKKAEVVFASNAKNASKNRPLYLELCAPDDVDVDNWSSLPQRRSFSLCC